MDAKVMLFMKAACAIFAKNGGGVWFYANNDKVSVDGGDAAMISLAVTKNELIPTMG